MERLRRRSPGMLPCRLSVTRISGSRSQNTGSSKPARVCRAPQSSATTHGPSSLPCMKVLPTAARQ